jgi:TPR repeat protein
VEIPALAGNWSPDLKQTIERCLQPNPWDRPTAKQIVNWKSHDSEQTVVGNKNRTKKWLVAGAIALLLTGVGAFFYMSHSHKYKHYTDNVVKAENFYKVAQYDSALAYSVKALGYVETDSIRQKEKMLNLLIPALNNFYNARYHDAFEGFQKAAEMGSGDACYYLGELTYNGLATVKDYNKGWEYTMQAFEKGFKMAYWRIAYAYETGRGIAQNKDSADYYYFEAIEGIKKPAENGDPEALANLGVMFGNGQGVSQNSKKAFEYCLKAAQSGYAFAMLNLSYRYRYGEGTAKDEEEAMKWCVKSAEMGNPGSLFSLGEIYLYGYCGQKIDVEKGIELITKAAEQNYSPALTKLGYLYWEGKKVKQDLNKSFLYSLQAVEYDKDNVVAMINVAHDYKNGNGVEKDYLKSKEYYLKALKSDSGRIDNYLYIGKLYKEGGPNLAKDENEYIQYCELAIRKGSENAKTELGSYFNSLGLAAYKKSNYAQARTYFNKAVRYGYETAQENLDYMNKMNK